MMDDRPKKEESEGILLEASMEMDEEDEDPEQVLQQQEEAVVGTTVGDEDVVAGPNIGENEFQDMGANENESSDEEDDGVIIHAGRITNWRTPSKIGRTPIGKELYTPNVKSTENQSAVPLTANEEELQKLRFTKQWTAFDVDISTLPDHPWRNRNVDILDYFNYGFNERTWTAYCEKQLRLRAEKGYGPQSVRDAAAAANAVSTTKSQQSQLLPQHSQQPSQQLSQQPSQQSSQQMPPQPPQSTAAPTHHVVPPTAQPPGSFTPVDTAPVAFHQAPPPPQAPPVPRQTQPFQPPIPPFLPAPVHPQHQLMTRPDVSHTVPLPPQPPGYPAPPGGGQFLMPAHVPPGFPDQFPVATAFPNNAYDQSRQDTKRDDRREERRDDSRERDDRRYEKRPRYDDREKDHRRRDDRSTRDDYEKRDRDHRDNKRRNRSSSNSPSSRRRRTESRGRR